MFLIEALRALPQEARHVRVDVEGQRGALAVSLPEGQLSVAFEPEGVNACSYVVDGKIVRLARALPAEALARVREDKLRLECGDAAYAFSALAAQTVALVAEPKKWAKKTVAAAWLRKALQYVKEAAATADVRYYLNGVYVRLEERNEVVASNGHVAAMVSAEGAERERPARIILPNKCVNEIVRLLEGDCDAPTIELGHNGSGGTMLRVRAGALSYVALGYEGVYPDYARIFADNQATAMARFEAEAVAAAVARLELTVQAKSPSLRVSFANGHLRLASTDNPDKDGVETVKAEDSVCGELECALNARYAATAIEAARVYGKRAIIGWCEPQKPLTICPATEEGARIHEQIKWIVAPFRE